VDIDLLSIISTYETTRISVKNGPSFLFRIEILTNPGRDNFFLRVHRLETMRMRPSFGLNQADRMVEDCDEEIWVRDHVLVEEEFSARSEESCLDYFRRKVAAMFG